MKKAIFKAISLLLAIILTTISLPAIAIAEMAFELPIVTLNGSAVTYTAPVPNVTADDFIYETYTENGVTKIRITRYKGTKTEIVLPNEFNGTVIGVIGQEAFEDCRSLTSINIPEGVTSISDSAFFRCSSLKSINIPKSVKSIGEWAFSYCSSLTSITIPEGVTSIGWNMFTNCSSLESITIPKGVITIGDSAFSGCSSLASITIPEGVTSIDEYAFEDCISLTSINIPKSVTSIVDYAFSGCSSLEIITVESGNTVYHSSGNCLIKTASKTLITGCKNSIIPTDGSVTSIKDEAFLCHSSLTSITIPEVVTTIGEWAFWGCSSLTSITIPKRVTSIGWGAFSGCSALESITVESGNTVYHSSGNSLIKTASKTLISGCKNSIIPTDGSVTSIYNSAFYNCIFLTSITIPKSVTSIDNSAFYGCSSLTSITIPKGVTSIGVQAFMNCSSLKSIIIPEGVTSIGDWAFYSCSSLESITVESGNTVYHSSGNCIIETKSKTLIVGCKNSIIPTDGSVTSIGYSAFENCSSLTSITIPEGVTSIEIFAFSYCSSLENITIPDGVTSIGDSAFSGCSSLTTIYGVKGSYAEEYAKKNGYTFVAPNVTADDFTYETYTENGVKKIRITKYKGTKTELILPNEFNGTVIGAIGEDAFYGCASLTSITVPKGISSIGNYAFNFCSSLKSITIPEGVTSIGSTAFSGCISLESVTIPESVTSIEDNTFSGCTSLTSITFSEGITSIGDYAFAGCSSLTSITIPEGVTSIGESTFKNCSSLTTIYGVKGSYAEEFANDNGYTFVAIGGVTVGGTISVAGGMDGVTVLLYSAEMSDSDIRADMKKSSPEKALSLKASMGSVSSEGNIYSRQFTFDGVDVGSYKLAIRKAGAYIVEVKSVTAYQTNVDVGTIAIGIIGDTDGNGKITGVDYIMCKRIVLETYDKVTERHKLASDVNGNGKVDATDYMMIKRHALGTYVIGA